MAKFIGWVQFLALAIIVHAAFPFYCASMWLRERRKKRTDAGP